MKNLIVTFLMACMGLYASAQDNFTQFESMEGVQFLDIKPRMFKLLSKIDLNPDDPEMKEYMDMVDDLEGIKLYTTEVSNTAGLMESAVTKYLSGAGLEELMRAKSDEANVKFYIKPGKSDDFVRELLMFVDSLDGGKRAVIIKITGNIDLRKVSKIANSLSFPGAEELKKAETK
ncbi:MAG: DUF4252 domain-containing protein [Leeuwenhoekiella sp.]